MEDMYIGKFLDDRYEILEKIGSGGMAVVYKALDHRLNRFVAIKILKADLAQDPDLRRRFHAESQAVAMLSHPNIVSVYDVNNSDGVDYIVMELIEGITLKQYINRKGILNWKEALHFTTQIAKALEHAHSRGIIHRDIKPHNIMILKDGNVKVADFGIARLLTTQNTLTQQALGSVHYISPEQAKGGAADTRSDLYSVGVVMYEMLTSRLPFEGDSAVSIAIQHISSVPLQPREINPDIPIGLEEITMKAMDPNINTRYQSATELIEDLEDFRKNPSVRFNYSLIPSMADDMDAGRSGRGSGMEIARRRVSGNGATRNRVSPEEYRENRRKAGRNTMLVGIFCIIILLVLLFWAMWQYFLKDIIMPEDEQRISIYNFVGAMYDDVVTNPDILLYYTFLPPKYDYDSGNPEGYILKQEPSATRSVTITDEKIEIQLYVAAGKQEVTMPYLINKDYRDARTILEGLNLGLDIKEEGRSHDSYTPDYVFDQIPKEDTVLRRGDTVYIIYSTGPEIPQVPVPDLYNLTEITALDKLAAMGLTGRKVEEYNENAPKGRVFQQSMDPNTVVDQGTEIVFYISLGPDPFGGMGGYFPPDTGGDIYDDEQGNTDDSDPFPPEGGGDTTVPVGGSTTIPGSDTEPGDTGGDTAGDTGTGDTGTGDTGTGDTGTGDTGGDENFDDMGDGEFFDDEEGISTSG